MIIYDIDLSYLPKKPAILINDMSDGQHSINGNLLNRCFENYLKKYQFSCHYQK